ncbi:MAG: hypothetical protein K2X82_13610 [Gemmataceae bacterium]|nr:hypothetical protein [Gemmataceae bacterium]
MTLLLLLAAAAIGIAAVFVISSKSDVHAVLAGDHPTPHPGLASENTLVGLTDPAAETMDGGSVRRAERAWAMTTLTNLSEAEEALDWAEVHGFAERELVVLGNSSFAVRWR